ncbi:hypothetical protein N2152v2_001382 [Parachlorella kessleri]
MKGWVALALLLACIKTVITQERTSRAGAALPLPRFHNRRLHGEGTVLLLEPDDPLGDQQQWQQKEQVFPASSPIQEQQLGGQQGHSSKENQEQQPMEQIAPQQDQQQQLQEEQVHEGALDSGLARQLLNTTSSSSSGSSSPERPMLRRKFHGIINNATAPAILRRLANDRRQVILLVFKVDPERNALAQLKNWAYHIGNRPPARLLNHTLMIVPDQASFRFCQEAGLPALLDKAFPFHYWESNPWYPEPNGVWHGINRYFDVAKHWWGLKVTELGYSVLYTDIDLVLLKDPLAYLASEAATSYDIQAQSDSGGPQDPPLGDMLEHPCTIYKLVREGKAPGGAQLREVWGFRGRDRFYALQAQSPCASTGFWYIRPTPSAKAFQRALVHRLVFSLPWGWDQVAWNEVIMPFLVGIGHSEPVRFRLLPLEDFLNLGTWEARKRDGLTADPIMLHTGGINGAQKKINALAQHDLWHPESWSPSVFDDFKQDSQDSPPANGGSGSHGGMGAGTAAAALIRGNSTVAAALKATLNETAIKVAAFQGSVKQVAGATFVRGSHTALVWFGAVTGTLLLAAVMAAVLVRRRRTQSAAGSPRRKPSIGGLKP